MNIRPVQISEIYKQAKETLIESIKSKAFSLYPAFVIYSLTIIFLLWISKLVLL